MWGPCVLSTLLPYLDRQRVACPTKTVVVEVGVLVDSFASSNTGPYDVMVELFTGYAEVKGDEFFFFSWEVPTTVPVGIT